MTDVSVRKILGPQAWICLALIGSIGTAAEAQTTASSEPSASAPTGLQEIVVTAERRSTNLQETPIAVSAVSGASLAEQHITNVQDLTTEIPNVNVQVYAGIAEISIRGIGLQASTPGADPRIAFYQDGIYIARPYAQLGAFFDVQDVEVLNGPQGTLFGRNATGGAVSVTSRAPTSTFTGYLNLTGGNYGLYQSEGAVSGPLTDTLAMRFAFQTLDHDGYGQNIFTGRDINNDKQYSLRWSTRWTPTAELTEDVIASFNHEHDYSGGFNFFSALTPGVPLAGQAFGGVAVLGNSRDIASDIQPTLLTESTSVTSTTLYQLSDAIALKALLGWGHSFHRTDNDSDGTTSYLDDAYLSDISTQYSAELQAIAKYDRFNWTAGLYYFNESEPVENHAVLNTALLGGPFQPVQGILGSATLATHAYAAYGQGTYNLTDALSATVGLRYSDESVYDRYDTREVDFARPYPPLLPLIYVPGFPRNQSVPFHSFDPKASIQYKFSPDIFSYASFTTGFKSGGYNYGNVQPAFLPEKIYAYEVGLKSAWLDDRLRANVSAFDYRYTNIQTPVVYYVPVSANIIVNAAGATVRGVELEMTALPMPGLRLNLSAAYLLPKFTQFVTGDGARPQLGLLDLNGNKLPDAPAYTLNTGAEYRWIVPGGDLTLRGEYQRIGKTYFTPFNQNIDSQDPYNWVNAFLTYKLASNWSLQIWGRNLTNAYVKTGVFDASGLLGGGGGISEGALAPPRTYGGTVGYSF